jgi:hypothetical protein
MCMSAPPTDRNARPTPHNDALCVLWHPRGQAPDPALVESLRRKGLRTIACDSPIEVAAWMCTMGGRQSSTAPATSNLHPSATQASAARPETGVGSLRPMVLLLDRPGDLLGAADMMAAMARYAPASVCWVHDPAASPRLRIIPWKNDPSPAPAPASSHVQSSQLHARTAAPAMHTLRLAGGGPVSLAPQPVVSPIKADPAQVVTLARTPRDILTDEELAMLLGDSQGPEQSPHSFR